VGWEDRLHNFLGVHKTIRVVAYKGSAAQNMDSSDFVSNNLAKMCSKRLEDPEIWAKIRSHANFFPDSRVLNA
jgi:hypothetical protein